MFEGIRSRLSAEIPGPEGKRKYVLEDVFWVPASNCKSRHSVSHPAHELPSDTPRAGEACERHTFQQETRGFPIEEQ